VSAFDDEFGLFGDDEATPEETGASAPASADEASPAQAEAPPEAFAGLAFERFSLQPMDGPQLADNTARAIDYCLRHPQWRLSLQTHKTLGIR